MITVDARAGLAAAPAFAEHLAVLPDFLPPERFAALAAEIEGLGRTERSFVPTHKKGGTIAYDTLRERAPGVVGFYRSAALIDRLGAVVGAPLRVTPERDNSSCSILVYERPGDHIDWHYDHNFYRGRHFTVLLPVVNRNADGTGLSAGRLFARIGGEERLVPTPPNRLVIFEGAKVLHRATPIGEGERRVVLSMTFGTDPRISLPAEIARRVKDTAFFGLRALWGGKARPA
jgi:hypothetical protein